MAHHRSLAESEKPFAQRNCNAALLPLLHGHMGGREQREIEDILTPIT